MAKLNKIKLHFTDGSSASILSEFEYGLTIINPHTEIKLDLWSKQIEEKIVIDDLYMAIADDAWYNLPKDETVNLVEKLQDKSSTITAITLIYDDKTETTYYVKFENNIKSFNNEKTNKFQKIWRDEGEYSEFTYIRISEKVYITDKLSDIINTLNYNLWKETIWLIKKFYKQL